MPLYWQPGWNEGTCAVASWQTQYSAAARDDYKRCVCDTWGMDAAAECAQGAPDDSNTFTADPEEDSSDNTDNSDNSDNTDVDPEDDTDNTDNTDDTDTNPDNNTDDD